MSAAIRIPLVLTAALLATALSGCGSDCFSCFDESPEADAAARKGYYEEAAKTYYDGGKYDAAARMWQKVLVETPNDQWARFGLAKSYHMIGTPQSLRKSEVILKDIVNLDWNHPTRGNVKFEVESTLANVYSSLSDFYSRDIRVLENRLENDPNADTKKLQEAITRQESMHRQLLLSSIPVWDRVLKQSPENPSALAGLSKAYLMTGSEDAGIHYADRYIRLSKKSQEGWERELKAYEEQRKGKVTRDQRAFYMDKIYGARAKELGVHLLLGSVYMRREQFAKAVDEYDAVLALDSATTAAYVERAQAYAALGLYPQAVKDLEQYLRITDPQKDRRARVNAADLLDRYRRLSGQAPLVNTARRAPVAPAPAPRAASSSPSGAAFGSPDGR